MLWNGNECGKKLRWWESQGNHSQYRLWYIKTTTECGIFNCLDSMKTNDAKMYKGN